MKVPALHKFRNDLAFPRILDRVQHLKPNWHLTRRSWQRREAVAVEAPSPDIVRAFRTFAKWASIIAMAVGYHAFLGWIFDISLMKAPVAGFTPIKINSAVCAFLAGVALYFVQTERAGLIAKRRIVIISCSAVVLVISSLTILEHTFTADLGIDRLFVSARMLETAEGVQPGRMGLPSSISFLLIGIALIGTLNARHIRYVEGCSLAATGMSLLAVAGYLYQAQWTYHQIPLYTAIVMCFVGTGILSAQADRGFMAKITSDSFGGFMARRLLPATLIVPLVLGWFQYRGQKAGLYASSPGLAFFSVANVVVFVTVVWWGVSSLHRMDTKRRQAEHELKDTAAKLSRSNADLEQFAYVASHDLKEPLRAISGSVQILQERYRGQIDPGADEVIKHTVDGATRMQTLIDDLLTYSRLTTREAPLAPTDCEVLLGEVLANLEASITESRAVVTHDPLPTVDADRTQLLQVFQNLISNGIKYRSERTPKIHIGAEERDDQWVFSVRDNGIGIAPQYADRIFRIFQRLHTRREYTGTGIGLAVCKKIVERHGGRIWVESEPEEGSTFFFTLPKRL